MSGFTFLTIGTLLLSYLTYYPNPVASIFRTCLLPFHFSLSPLLPWFKPLTPLAWVTAKPPNGFLCFPLVLLWSFGSY